MRKLKVSIVTFLLVLISAVTTTYAWLSMATVNTLKDISLNAVKGYDLLMSLDGETYYENIPIELIDDQIKRLKFNNVTTSDGINFNGHYKENMEVVKNRDYLSLTFYFKTSSRYTEIHLADNLTDVKYNEINEDDEILGTYITSKGKVFKSNYKFLYDEGVYVEEGETREYFAKDAMRVSFIDNETNTSKIFDLSGNEHRGFGKSYGAHSYYKSVTGKEIKIPDTPETIYKLSEFSTEVPRALTDSSLIVTMKETDEKNDKGRFYSVGSVTMNVWLEGFDADAFDAIYSDQVKMQFMFKAVMPKEIEI